MPAVPRLEPFSEFFARMWSIDIACPSCGTLHLEVAFRRWRRSKSTARLAAWDPLTSHFICRECDTHFVLGIVAWRPPVGGAYRAPPADHQPKAWHLARMRDLLGPGGFLLGPNARLTLRQEANLLIEQPCSCTLDAAGVPVRNLQCAVHGRAPVLEARPDPRWGPGKRIPKSFLRNNRGRGKTKKTTGGGDS